MKIYENEDGKRFGFENDGSQDYLITEGMTPVSDEDLQADALDLAKRKKKKEIHVARNALIGEPVVLNIDSQDHYFDGDILDWNGAALTMSDVELWPRISQNNEIVQLSKEQILLLCDIIHVRKNALMVAARQFKDDVLNLEGTVEDIESYTYQF